MYGGSGGRRGRAVGGWEQWENREESGDPTPHLTCPFWLEYTN